VSALPELVPCLLERHRVRARIAGLQARERAEQTTGNADVGGLEPDVVVVKRAVAVLLLALAVRQPANGEQIRTIEQSNPVGEIQPTAGVEFCGDVSQAGGA